MSSQGVKLYHNKLIRDGLPEYFENKGIKFTTVTIYGEDKLNALEKKILEEFDEYKEKRYIGEMADLIEVAYGICSELGYSQADIDIMRLQKRRQLGGFNNGIFLIETIE
jgi:predicted house-cleaning noncanonical NTP pyrophosphatase (MazG superfamily)